jgi:type IV pilus assembly protein PilC
MSNSEDSDSDMNQASPRSGWSSPAKGDVPELKRWLEGRPKREHWLKGLIKEEQREEPEAKPPPAAQPDVVQKRDAPPAVRPGKAEGRTHLETQPAYSSSLLESSKLIRQRALVLRALSVMMEAGIVVYGAFEFLAEQCEDLEISLACRRIAQELAQGKSLAKVALREPRLFQETSARMLEVAVRTGKLVAVLDKLATDEEDRWAFRSRLTSQLVYPVLLATLALLTAVLLPPLALSKLLDQMLKFTDDPPFVTVLILKVSNVLSSPTVLACIVCGVTLALVSLRLRVVQERLRDLEYLLWSVPGVGPFLRVVFSIRFCQLFSMMNEVGLPAMQCLELASAATGSRVIGRLTPVMQSTLMAGGTLSESLAAADFLPRLCLESVESGEQVGKIPVMMRSASRLLSTELEYRMEALLALLEPLMLSFLGVCVGVFALGCLLPILKLVETI